MNAFIDSFASVAPPWLAPRTPISRPNFGKNSHRGPVRFPGSVAFAAIAGIDRTTLFRVLMGQLPDHHNLRSRFADFTKRRAGK